MMAIYIIHFPSIPSPSFLIRYGNIVSVIYYILTVYSVLHWTLCMCVCTRTRVCVCVSKRERRGGRKKPCFWPKELMGLYEKLK